MLLLEHRAQDLALLGVQDDLTRLAGLEEGDDALPDVRGDGRVGVVAHAQRNHPRRGPSHELRRGDRVALGGDSGNGAVVAGSRAGRAGS